MRNVKTAGNLNQELSKDQEKEEGKFAGEILIVKVYPKILNFLS